MQEIDTLNKLGRQLGLPKSVLGELIGVSRQQLHYYLQQRNKPHPARQIKIRQVVEELRRLSKDEPALRVMADGIISGRITTEAVRKALDTLH